jgi:hypothetical protein
MASSILQRYIGIVVLIILFLAAFYLKPTETFVSGLANTCSKYPPCTLESANFYNTVLGLYNYNRVLGNVTNI